jgi:hypothetical protein
MVKFLLAPLIVFAVLAGWVWVQSRYTRFAAANPQLGPFRREDGGCSCGSVRCEQPSLDRIKNNDLKHPVHPGKSC